MTSCCGEPEPLGDPLGQARHAAEMLAQPAVALAEHLEQDSVLWRLAASGPAFCSYMRWSARRSASAGEDASDGTSAMPWEQPMENASPVLGQCSCSERDNGFGAGRLDRGQDAELVTTHPIGGADSIDGGRQALTEPGKKGVARRMAERVVVLLEAVEVEEREDDVALAAGVRQLGIEVVDQSPPVGKPCQRVGAGFLMAGGGHSRVLTGEALGDCTSQRGTPVEEDERQCEHEDRNGRAHCGAESRQPMRAGRTRGWPRRAHPHRTHVLAGKTRQVVCARLP